MLLGLIMQNLPVLIHANHLLNSGSLAMKLSSMRLCSVPQAAQFFCSNGWCSIIPIGGWSLLMIVDALMDAAASELTTKLLLCLCAGSLSTASWWNRSSCPSMTPRSTGQRLRCRTWTGRLPSSALRAGTLLTNSMQRAGSLTPKTSWRMTSLTPSCPDQTFFLRFPQLTRQRCLLPA